MRLKRWWNKRHGDRQLCTVRWWCTRLQLRMLWPYWADRRANFGYSCRVHAFDRPREVA